MSDNSPEASTVKPFSFDDIDWSGRPALRDTELWERNIGVVRLLLESGTVPTRIIDTDHARGIPRSYAINGVPVEFLPHWGFYRVGDLNLATPVDAAMLQEDVAAAGTLATAQLAAAEYVATRSPAAK